MTGPTNTLILFIVFHVSGTFLDQMNIHVYCRERNRLINTDELDEYLLVDVELKATLRLQCHFCNEAFDNQPKFWFHQDRYQQEKERELEIGMNNNMSTNKIHLNSGFDLVIRDFNLSNAGVYRCHGIHGEDAEKKFNYRLEPVFDEPGLMDTQIGNLSEWENYRKINLIPVSNRFAVSPMSSLSVFRNAGVILEVVSEWSEWGPCERCVEKKGVKASTAQCRLKSNFVNRTLSSNESLEIVDKSEVVDFFKKSRLLPCRSYLLDEKFPILSQTIRNLPNFILEEKCENCRKVKKVKRDDFKYKKRYTLAVGAYLTIVCPESNMKSHVVWRKEKTVLEIGSSQSLGVKDKRDRILIDPFSTLYLRDVSDDESGNYTCYVDGVRIMQATVVVVAKSSLITQALIRHMGYLGVILFITSLCYCAGIMFACKNPNKYATKDYKMVLEDMKKNQYTLLDNW